MKIQKIINTKLEKCGLNSSVDVVQFDTGIELLFNLLDYSVPSGTKATLYVEKPSGKFVYQSDNITVSETLITVQLNNQAVTEYGKAKYQLVLKNGNDTISSFCGVLKIEQSLNNAGATESKTVVTSFDQLTADEIQKIQTKTTEKINEIVNETANQKALLQAKGEEVLGTIPTDYTETYRMANEGIRTKADAIQLSTEGTAITVNDSSDDYIRGLSIEGKSEQKSYTGKNLLNTSLSALRSYNTTNTWVNNTYTNCGITYTPTYDTSGYLQYILINGTVEDGKSESLFGIYNNASLPKGMDYNVSLRGSILESAIDGVSFQVYKSVGGSYSAIAGIPTTQPFIIPADSERILFRLRVAKGYTINNLKVYPMVILSSTEDRSYEPYVGAIPSPNPIYPQPINSVAKSGNIEVVSCGKNLINVNNPKEFRVNVAGDTRMGYPITINEIGKYYLYIKAKDDTGINFYYGIQNKNYDNSSTGTIAREGEKFFNITNTTDKIIIWVGKEITHPHNYIDKIMLVKSDVAISYEPYTETKATLNLSDLRSLPNGVKDTIERNADCSYKVVRRVGHTVLTGSEYWMGIDTQNTDNTFYISAKQYDSVMSKTSNTIISNIAKYGVVWSTDTHNVVFNQCSEFALRFRVSKSIINSVDSWKTYLQEHYTNGTPVYVQYELPTPTEEEISVEQINNLKTYYNVTNLTSNDPLNPNMKLTYNADTKLYIDNKFNELAQKLI